MSSVAFRVFGTERMSAQRGVKTCCMIFNVLGLHAEDSGPAERVCGFLKHPMFLVDTIDKLASAEITAAAKHMDGSDGRMIRLSSNQKHTCKNTQRDPDDTFHVFSDVI